MANTPQAAKRARQNAKRRLVNFAHRTRFRTYHKRVVAAIEEKDAEAAKKAFKEFVCVADNVAGKGKTVHPNKAARIKSRLNTAIKSLAANQVQA